MAAPGIDGPPDPLHFSIGMQKGMRMRQIMAELEQRDRQISIRCYREHKSLWGLAQEVWINESRVSQLRKRAFKRLRIRMQFIGIGNAA